MTVIGITGASCAGKSTLSKALWRRYRTTSTNNSSNIHVIHCDTFRAYTLFGYRHTTSDGRREWEHPSNAAWNAIQVEVQARRSSMWDGDLLIIDGYMISEDDRLMNLLDVLVYVNIDKTICQNRRMKRRMPAPNGWNAEEYFERFIWKAHVKRHHVVTDKHRSSVDILTLDGTRQTEQLVDQVLDAIHVRRKGSIRTTCMHTHVTSSSML